MVKNAIGSLFLTYCEKIIFYFLSHLNVMHFHISMKHSLR